MIRHNHRHSQTLIVCASRMLAPTCVLASYSSLYSTSETCIRPKIVAVLRSSIAIPVPTPDIPLRTEREPTIEYP